ncbi:MAG: response regulator transcription factor [Bacteroidales bacterium]|nr:response regulator transcription factor [Bacteroidales bacterium]
MTIRCIAIDDEPLALRQMADFIRKTPFLELVAECNSAFEAMEVLESGDTDLMFVDINMPGLSGLEFIKSLNSKRPEVIFTTAYSEFAIEGFKVEALDYLLKPIGYSDFLKAANKAYTYFQTRSQADNSRRTEDEFLFVKSEYRLVRIRLEDIRYIEGMREYVRIHTTTSKPVMTLMSMKALEDKLPRKGFMRVHRSYIVNLNCITTIERGRIVFDKDVYIPVGEQYKGDFQKFVDGHFL